MRVAKIPPRVRAYLTEFPESSQRDISEALSISYGYTYVCLSRLRGRHQGHIARFELRSGQWIALWSLGDKPDARRPKRMPPAELARRWAAANPAKYEAKKRRRTIARGYTPRTRGLSILDQLRAAAK